MDWTRIVLLTLLIISGAYKIFMDKKSLTNLELLADVRQQVFMLFLYAEKQDWTSVEKWSFCVNKLYDTLPETVKKLIPTETLEAWIDSLYKEFKEFLSSTKLEESLIKNN